MSGTAQNVRNYEAQIAKDPKGLRGRARPHGHPLTLTILREALEMTTVVILGPNSHAGCPECGLRIAFFSGETGAFISEERRFASNTALQLDFPVNIVVCCIHSGCSQEVDKGRSST